MRLLAKRSWFGGALVVGAWVGLGACNGTPVGVVDDDAGDGGGDAMFEASGDATIDGSRGGETGSDAPADGTMTTSDAGPDANDGGAPETSMPDSGEAGADAGTEAATESGTSEDASADGPAEDASSDATSDATGDAPEDAPTEAASDAPSDAPLEAAPCAFAGTWSMTVQDVTAVPTLCQGVMDCTDCGILFLASSTLPSATTIDWNVDPGGTICTDFSGSITSGGQFTTSETNCSPQGDGTTFDGQIDLSTCSLTATYVYVLNNSCTITETMTGTQ